METWKNCKLGNLLKVKHGFAFKGEHFKSEGRYILLTPGNFYESGGFKFTPEKEKYYAGTFPKEYICSRDDLIVAMTEQAEGLLGSTALVPCDDLFLHNQRIGLVSYDRKKADKHFLYYLFRMKSVRKQLRGSASGTKVKHTSPDRIYDVNVRIPSSVITQSKIAAILSALDAKIDLNNRINAELEAIAKSLYDYWFVQFDFPDENGKPYKSSGGKMVWNKELKREIPEGWEVGSLLDIADYENGLPCQKFRPTGNDFLRVIKIKEMRDGFTSESELVKSYIPQKAIVENGDVLFSWSASLEVQIWTGGRGALNQHIFKVTSTKYPKSFYFYQLVNYLQHFKMMADNRRTTMGHITQDHLKQSRIVLVPTKLTEMLEEKISPILTAIINSQIENQHLSSLRDWLLPMLMNGQVTVS
jgi:type I restriction enzyme S subunit